MTSIINTIVALATAFPTVPVNTTNATDASTLVNSLTQNNTNGLSVLGTVNAPLLDYYVANTSSPPWDPSTINTNPYTDPPNTNITVQKTLVISRGIISPDGVNRSVMLINGSFPGPTLEADWGDTFEINVINNLDNEGTALHWHGFLQKGTPYYDGVPSVQQCPIAPGSSFTYRFQADLYGTTWYHSHYSAQFGAGLFGPMVIHGPLQPEISYDEDLGPIILSDWFHVDYFDIVENIMHPVLPVTNPPSPVISVVGPQSTNVNVPISENLLINGKNNFDCANVFPGQTCTPQAGLSKFNFTAGQTYRLRLINAAAEATLKFSIDEHEMTVFANDFVPIEPYNTTVVTLGVGQRSDVLVTANGDSGSSYYMRSRANSSCSSVNVTEVDAVIFYDGANTTALPTSTPQPITWDSTCQNDDIALTHPYVTQAAATNVVTQKINITFGQNSSGNFIWDMNGSSFRADYNDPLLNQTHAGNFSYEPEWNVYNFGSNNTIRLVVYNSVPAVAHPMHIHGHNMRILAVGNGTWDGHITNPSNPQRRDVQMLSGALDPATPSYIVIEFEADNPGVWPFHCHIAWHVSAGLYINLLEMPEQIDEMNIPQITAQTCDAWNLYTSTHVIDDIDSGL